jgi:hypothetical protein
VARLLFRFNARYVSLFIVQSEIMKDMLESAYPDIRGRVTVIPQPAPAWLIESGLLRRGRRYQGADRLDLLYPADNYPYKNHALLGAIRAAESAAWPVARLRLTLPESANPNRRISWISCVGTLSPTEMVEAYAETDAVLYLSLAESYGLPLIEAMYLGLPVVAPDLPYARSLCGDEAIYFAADRPESLRLALDQLQRKLSQGWWPNWTNRLAGIPASWSVVARQFLHSAQTAITLPARRG